MVSDRELFLFEYAIEILKICEEKKNLKTYDGFVPIISELYSDEYGIFTDVKLSDLNKKLNVSGLRLGLPDGRGAMKDTQFINLREVTPKEFRKKCGLFTPKPYVLEITFSSRAKPVIVPLTVKNGSLTILETPREPISEVVKVDTYNTIQSSLGIQFNLENQPRVYLRPENGHIGFTLPIDSLSQLKELFSLREIPDGYKRRVALLHWVSKHLRRKPSDHTELIEVKKHLRGREDFEWFGIKGTIYND